jgi:tetratricopeptide (TPR) repeat protein
MPSWPSAAPSIAPGSFIPEDRALTNYLAEKANHHQALTPQDVEATEKLYGEHPNDNYRKFLERILLVAASGQAAQHHNAEAITYLHKALALDPDSPLIRQLLVELERLTLDWTSMEATSRDALLREPRNPYFLRALGLALFRQDRNVEAAEALKASLELQEEPYARSVLDRIRRGASDEKGMTEQRLAHFDVRYDGEAHDELGREIVTNLEHDYATLATSLDYELQTKVPVIILTRERYYETNQSWSGGGFDTLDGRIRIPVLGLGPSLTPFMKSTLLHELTHAFVNERTRGIANSDLQEGFAQYMEGKRLPPTLTPAQANALVTAVMTREMGPIVVGDYYAGALSYVEYLVANRGQGGINELLKVMGETGNMDEAFRQVYGKDAQEMRKAWGTRLEQQSGG